MKESVYKNYDDLPLFLNSETVAKVMGIAPSSAYELMHEPGFPVLKIGSRIPIRWSTSIRNSFRTLDWDTFGSMICATRMSST